MTVAKYCHRCAAIVDPEHKHKVKDRRPSPRKKGFNAKWERTRRAFLTMFPICQWHEGCMKPALHVHHLDGLGPDGPRGHDWGNLQGLCHPHHSTITAQEQPGGWNVRA
jgi:5-methylcytosine-specific restriction protein A